MGKALANPLFANCINHALRFALAIAAHCKLPGMSSL
jgi:hypothetical protein